MFGAMAMLRKIDQEEPLVLLYARVGYLVYVGIAALVYILLHFRIIACRDTTLVTVPLNSKGPSISEAIEQARKAAEKAQQDRLREQALENGDDKNEGVETSETSRSATASADSEESANDETSADQGDQGNQSGNNNGAEEAPEKTEIITIMEYDLRQLSSARWSWVTSSCFLAAVHYHMESVSPLVMSALMGIIRLLSEDPLVQIHLLGSPAVGKLTRPFVAEKSPLAALMKEMTPKADDKPAESTQTARPEEDLHRDADDDDDDDDDAPAGIADMKDDHIRGDFEEDENVDTDKKRQ